MTTDPDPVPGDWDALPERDGELPAELSRTSGTDEPAMLALLASSWAELVGILAVCTGALVAVLLIGERPTLPAFGWAAALAVSWWLAAAAACLVVRQATPGMLLAGLRFAEPVAPRRLGWALAAALVGAVALGAVHLLGRRAPLLATAGGSPVVPGEEL